MLLTLHLNYCICKSPAWPWHAKGSLLQAEEREEGGHRASWWMNRADSTAEDCGELSGVREALGTMHAVVMALWAPARACPAWGTVKDGCPNTRGSGL